MSGTVTVSISKLPVNKQSQRGTPVKGKKGKGTVKPLMEPLMEVFHDTATECHLLYGITQCYLLPDTSEHTPP